MERSGSKRSARLVLAMGGARMSVALDRCVSGRLQDAYPVGERDVEIVLEWAEQTPVHHSEVLADLVDAIERVDPGCRRVVVATEFDERKQLAAVEGAGFRYVLDVDIPDGSFCLAVAEPDWVTDVDMDLEHVPGS